MLRWERSELWDWFLDHPGQDVRQLRKRVATAWSGLKIVCCSLMGRREWIHVDPPWKGLKSLEFPRGGRKIGAIRSSYDLLKVRVAYLNALSPQGLAKWNRFCEVRRQLKSNAEEIRSLSHLTPIEVKASPASLWISPSEAGECRMKCLFRGEGGATLGVAGLTSANLCKKLSELPTSDRPLSLLGMPVVQLVKWQGDPQPIRTQEELDALKVTLFE